ncbi:MULTISPECIES: type II toxin-antitoxin system RnlA family toxin [Lactococcus]|jgi:hypothetical protein|uniref:Type II toxin-antitoxin system RnlA family toxin n=1 Tax=Lactococcus formosensis TaxID=1281486 RepID=A0A9Q8Y321_9LACT|nr:MULTISPECIES: type II toxin-antitoxin system RnlA family toxin [Lactococcus]USI66518.1 type II toxin-antitoxin system RnlA family toxin [Lactococcus petauri]USI68961.1 type II toxin-antitoxin system RnlA family toxin [Lactococcus petauri]USJ21148.1 type II toxin-antitoxin system RnlA family toxin [Lactococcus formosensis]WJE13629.1 type II toxin-antitoxin system RnlA family toxin [Lactococcus petauri]
MANKNKGLLLSQEDVKQVFVENYDQIVSVVKKNPSTGQTRYTVVKDGVEFYIDIYFKQNGRITVSPLGMDTDESSKIKSKFEEKSRCKEVIAVNFTTKISNEDFKELIEYLSTAVKDLVVSEPDDKGTNGIIYHCNTNFGDNATLTYWNSTQRMRFQGDMISIYSEVRSFILPLTTADTVETTFENRSPEEVRDSSDAALEFLNQVAPKFYQCTLMQVKELLKDAASMVLLYKENNITLSDYSPIPMPVLKVIEYRIKEIAGNHGIIMNNRNNMGTIIGGPEGHRVVQKKEIPSKYHPILLEMEAYYSQQRNGTFHLPQQIQTARIIETFDEAQTIVIGALKLLEKSNIE